VRFSALILILVAAAGCSTIRSGQTKTIMDAYIGQTVADVAARFGPPTGDFAIIDNGQMAFQWDHFGVEQSPGPAANVPAGRPSLGGCGVLVSTLPISGDVPPAILGNWIVKSWQTYGNCP
jgi:hypothetical protein